MDNSLGKKLRSFRETAHLSQQYLEEYMNASPGTISKIENGLTNPTKETLVKIADALKLSVKEKSDLFNISTLHPTDEEINSAISEVENVLENDSVYAYLLDDWWIVRGVSRGLLKLLGLPIEAKDIAIGKNLLTVMFDPTLGVRGSLDSDKLIENYAIELARARSELNEDQYGNYFEKIIDSIKDTPDFEMILKKSIEISQELFTVGTRISYINFNNRKIKVNHTRVKLKKNPRFELVELFNPVAYT